MAMNTMRAAGRTLRLRFDLQAWLEIEERFDSLGAMLEALDRGARPMRASLDACAILARAGARHAGEPDAPDAAWMAAHLSPRQANALIRLARAAIVLGLRREDVEQEDEDVDVVAEEIAKKKRGSSPPAPASDTP